MEVPSREKPRAVRSSRPGSPIHTKPGAALRNILGGACALAGLVVGLSSGAYPQALWLGMAGVAIVILPGRAVERDDPIFRYIPLAAALLLPPGMLWTVIHQRWVDIWVLVHQPWFRVVFYLASVAGVWLTTSAMMHWAAPAAYGDDERDEHSLPRLRLAKPANDERANGVGIAGKQTWSWKNPWVRRSIGVAITIAIFVWMLKPIVTRWPEVGGRIMQTSAARFVIASFMFSIFLFVFRAFSWRRILQSLGHRLNIAPATRIWSASELARYVPGSIMQVIGRAYLAKPYGIDGATSSTSQVLELTIFLLANVLMALVCLPWFAAKIQGNARIALWSAAGLAPLLLILLYPPVFYGLMNRILRALKKKPIAGRVSGPVLIGLLVWAVLGLAWQGLAIWILTAQPQALDLDPSRIGLVIGAYCLAWCAGFLAFWAPGGIGMREAVLVAALQFALPPALANHIVDQQVFNGFLAFLAVLLRLWTITGELILATCAYTIDYRGALGHPDAPGRVPVASAASIATAAEAPK
jgi:hypothetical protein